MTDAKPVSVQARNRRAQLRKQTPHGSNHYWQNSLHSTLLALLPGAWDGIDAPTDGSHLLQTPLMTAAAQRRSTVMADVITIFGGNIAEEPESLELTDRVVDRLRTDLVEASTSIWQRGSDS